MEVSDFEGFVQDVEAKARLIVLGSHTGLQEWTKKQEKATYMKA